MAIVQTQVNATDRVKMATGTFADSAGSTDTVALGFVPRLIVVENETDRIKWTWRTGMTSGYAIQDAAAGTRTLETSGGITILATGKGFSYAATAAKQYRWEAFE